MQCHNVLANLRPTRFHSDLPQRWPSLRSLDLSSCEHDVGPNDIAALQSAFNLEDLSLRVTKEGDAPALTRQLSHLPRLRSLDLSRWDPHR